MLKVQLFGKFQIEESGRVLPGLRGAKVQELFAYLLLNRPRAYPRESLANLLWSEGSRTGAKKYLRQALWQLQNALEGHSGGENAVLLLEPEWLGANARANLWLDVEELERSHQSVRGIPGQRLTSEQAQGLKSAVECYAGDLLEGCYEDWCLFERERLQDQYLGLLDKLMTYAESHSDYEEGLVFANRILQVDRAREHTHQQVMRLHYLSGNRTEALRQFERCRQALLEELDVEPGSETLLLYQQISQDQLRNPALDTVSEASLPAVLHRLRDMQTDLLQLLQRVQKEVRTMELQLEQPN